MYSVFVFLLFVQQVYIILHMQADGRRGGPNETITKSVDLLQYLIPSENGGNGTVLVLFKTSFPEHLLDKKSKVELE